MLKPERVIDPTTNMLALGIPALAVVTLGLSRTGGSLAFLGVIASIVHVLAMAVWFGGVVLLARVVLAGPGEEDLVHAVRGFGRISNPAIIATVVSGLVQVYRQVSASDLFGTGHGRVFLLKTVAVAAMLFVGLTARQIARAKLTRASELSIKTADRLRRAFGTEAAIGVIVIALSGWLLALNPGKVEEDDGDFAVSSNVEVPALDFEISVALDPGQIGLNGIRVVVTPPGDRVVRPRAAVPSARGLGRHGIRAADHADLRRRGLVRRRRRGPARRRRHAGGSRSWPRRRRATCRRPTCSSTSAMPRATCRRSATPTSLTPRTPPRPRP